MSGAIEEWITIGVVAVAAGYLVLRVTGLAWRRKRPTGAPAVLGPRLERGIKKARGGCCDTEAP